MVAVNVLREMHRNALAKLWAILVFKLAKMKEIYSRRLYSILQSYATTHNHLRLAYKLPFGP